MPALIPTQYTATVTWLGVNPDRDAALETQALHEMALGFAGHAGESRAGLVRPSDSRVIFCRHSCHASHSTHQTLPI